VLSKLLNLCTQLLTNIVLARNQYLLSLNSYLRISMFLALLYVRGHACCRVHTNKFVTPISKYYSTDVSILNTFQCFISDVSMLKTIHWISKTIFQYLTKYSSIISTKKCSRIWGRMPGKIPVLSL
jgi:hypothetical protein